RRVRRCSLRLCRHEAAFLLEGLLAALLGPPRRNLHDDPECRLERMGPHLLGARRGLREPAALGFRLLRLDGARLLRRHAANLGANAQAHGPGMRARHSEALEMRAWR